MNEEPDKRHLGARKDQQNPNRATDDDDNPV
jgi:hypothetical protein